MGDDAEMKCPAEDRLVRFPGDTRGQAMTEYVILTAVMVAVAAYLYHRDNKIFHGIRRTYDKTSIIMRLPGP